MCCLYKTTQCFFQERQVLFGLLLYPMLSPKLSRSCSRIGMRAADSIHSAAAVRQHRSILFTGWTHVAMPPQVSVDSLELVLGFMQLWHDCSCEGMHYVGKHLLSCPHDQTPAGTLCNCKCNCKCHISTSVQVTDKLATQPRCRSECSQQHLAAASELLLQLTRTSPT